MSFTATIAAVVGTTVGLLKESAIFQRLWMLICSLCSILFWTASSHNTSPFNILKSIFQWANWSAAGSFVDGIKSWFHDPSRTIPLVWVCLLLILGIICGAIFSHKNLAGFSVYPVLMIWDEVVDVELAVCTLLVFLLLLVLNVFLPKIYNEAVDGYEAQLRTMKSLATFLTCPFYVLVLPVILMVGL